MNRSPHSNASTNSTPSPADHRLPFARADALDHLGRIKEAHAAATRALAQGHDPEPVHALIRALSR